jgi:hypothetical protein
MGMGFPLDALRVPSSRIVTPAVTVVRTTMLPGSHRYAEDLPAV